MAALACEGQGMVQWFCGLHCCCVEASHLLLLHQTKGYHRGCLPLTLLAPSVSLILPPSLRSPQAVRGAVVKRLEWLDANFLAAVNAFLAVPGVTANPELAALLGAVRTETLALVGGVVGGR